MGIDKESALRKLQNEELDILIKFREYCAENGLAWFIDSGTVLGARRHGGFIPWDDDIDVGMPRADYDRLIKLALDQGRFPEGYSLHTYENTSGFSGFFAKIYKEGTLFETQEAIDGGCRQGIFVDVFPYDYLKNTSLAHRSASRAGIWQRVSYLYHSKTIVVPHKGVLGWMEQGICRIAHYASRIVFSRDKLAKYYRRAEARLNAEDAERLIIPCYPMLPGIEAEKVLPVSKLEFEGESFPAPAKPDDYLAFMYGDWQKLPDPENRKTHLPLKLVFSDGEVYDAKH